MTSSTPGLRERKKARTRWAIQDHALRLFAEQGYDNTTVDQIAAAAEISPSTFFRYFPTKEDVVVQDEFDDQIVDSFRAAGASADPLETFRTEIVRQLSGAGREIMEAGKQRTALILAVPALRARTVENVIAGFDDAVKGFAEGSGRSPDDPAVHMFVGLAIGGLMPVLMRWAASGYTEDLLDLLDRGISGLKEILSPR